MLGSLVKRSDESAATRQVAGKEKQAGQPRETAQMEFSVESPLPAGRERPPPGKHGLEFDFNHDGMDFAMVATPKMRPTSGLPMPHDNAVALWGRHLTRTFGAADRRTIALDDVCLDLPAGQLALLMGPSGSGKSTLLAVLSGLLRPDRGQVLALGQDLWAMSDRQREQFRLRHCGFIFQDHNLFAALTARQQLELVLRWGGGVPGREARRRADEMLGLLGLKRQGHLRPLELSGGEKQRVAIGRALIKGPRLCFADEPTSSLDRASGDQVLGLLRNAAHDGAMVLVVAHDPRIIKYADCVFHLEDGRLKEGEDDSCGPELLTPPQPPLPVRSEA
jgi:putative ABC transport system ATP-binding protein